MDASLPLERLERTLDCLGTPEWEIALLPGLHAPAGPAFPFPGAWGPLIRKSIADLLQGDRLIKTERRYQARQEQECPAGNQQR